MSHPGRFFQRIFPLFASIDWILLIAVMFLCAIGLSTIYGIGISQHTTQGLFTFYKQLVACALGLLGATCLAYLDYRHMRSTSMLLYIGGALLLLFVIFAGDVVNGTRGWFRIGSLSFQPIEIAKLTMIAYVCALFARAGKGALSWALFGRSGVAVGLYIALTLLQPDFGSAMVLAGSWLILCLFKGLPRFAWIILPVIGAVLAGGLWLFALKPYQKARITTFINPSHDTRGSSYNAQQARIAFGSGGWLGKGIGEGSQARLRFLPESSTDFIFAVVGEEWGFIGVLATFGAFGVVLWRYITIAQQASDEYGALLALGLGSVFFIHILVNTGMNMGVAPITGIPLPFISAAASYMVVAFLSVGSVQSIAIRGSFTGRS